MDAYLPLGKFLCYFRVDWPYHQTIFPQLTLRLWSRLSRKCYFVFSIFLFFVKIQGQCHAELIRSDLKQSCSRQARIHNRLWIGATKHSIAIIRFASLFSPYVLSQPDRRILVLLQQIQHLHKLLSHFRLDLPVGYALKALSLNRSLASLLSFLFFFMFRISVLSLLSC